MYSIMHIDKLQSVAECALFGLIASRIITYIVKFDMCTSAHDPASRVGTSVGTSAHDHHLEWVHLHMTQHLEWVRLHMTQHLLHMTQHLEWVCLHMTQHLLHMTQHLEWVCRQTSNHETTNLIVATTTSSTSL